MITLTTENLRIGDTIEVWWKPKRDTITHFTPYAGPLAKAGVAPFNKAIIAYFAICTGGMTMFPDEEYKVVNRDA
jgi:hypothetical protein